MNWIEWFIESGVLETAFELDGGIHVTASPVGAEEISVREQNSFREAMNELMKRMPQEKRP